jgi:hypothetical protein
MTTATTTATTFPEPAGAVDVEEWQLDRPPADGSPPDLYRHFTGRTWTVERPEGVGLRRHDRAMKFLLLVSVLIAAGLTFVSPASADPTPSPSPYQIQGPNGPVYGGMRTLPPICGTQPRACAGDWNLSTGAWDFPGT